MYSVFQNKIKNKLNNKSGFVLVSVLMLGTMLITCATAFAWFSRMHVKNALREKVSLTNRSMAQVLIKAITAALKANTIIKYDSPLLDWFKPFFFPADDMGSWVIQVVPLDDKIPVRNLFLPDGSTLRTEFRDTWDEIMEKLESDGLSETILDFLDKDTKPKMGGSEQETHINRALLDMSELLLLENMTPEVLYGTPEKRGFADYCTLWSEGKINLNVAPVHVMEILPGMDKSLADKIESYRKEKAITSMDDLSAIPGFPPKTRSALMNIARFSSRYFMVKIEILEDTGGGTSFNIILDKTAGTIARWEEI